jgi:uncharacterized membrane protein YcgQ (UPF0703/DUF1980 family)
MRKIILISSLLSLIVLFTTACSKSENSSIVDEDGLVLENSSKNTRVIEISEKLFSTHVYDIYLNEKNYLGKTISLEGIFKKEPVYGDEAPTLNFVVRYGLDCCIADTSYIGFEVRLNEKRALSYPDDDAWVSASGVLKSYTEGHSQYLYLDLISLDVLEKRGIELISPAGGL